MNDLKNAFESVFELCDLLSPVLAAAFRQVLRLYKNEIQELRLRREREITVTLKGNQRFITKDGMLSCTPERGIRTSSAELEEVFRRICNYSVHTHMKQLCDGFITIKGGHRIGIGGTAVIEQGKTVSVRELSSLNIRIARQIFGSADPIFSYLKEGAGGMLIAGPPGSGKTTVIRDLARQLCSGYRTDCRRATIVDERGEIACCFGGVPQMEVGSADVLSGYPKKEGMLLAIRSLSPEFLFCDELGESEEIQALNECIHCGVRVVATVHASAPSQLLYRSGLKQLLLSGAFEKIVFLENAALPAQIAKIFDVKEVFTDTEEKEKAK